MSGAEGYGPGENDVKGADETVQSRSSSDIRPVNERRLTTKLDLRILPVLTLVYILSFIDRVNIGNALLFGLRSDLKITDNQYSIALSIFFISYCGFEVPANILMKKLRPPIFLSVCVFLFGLFVVCQGFCKNLGSLLALRFLLGMAEAGTLPGCVYLISMWYKREEAQRRIMFFYSGASLAGAFGGLLASGIGNLDNYNGHRGWKWIFWLEGGFTCLAAFIIFFLIPDFPEHSKWLKEDERQFITARLEQQQGASQVREPISKKSVFNAFKDWRLIPTAIMYFGPACSLNGLAFFTPSIVQTYKLSPIQSQLYSVPPWAAAFVFSMIIAWLSDKTRQRAPFAVFCLVLALAAAATLSQLPVTINRDARFACLILYLMGAFTAGPMIVCWTIMNLEGHLPRAVGVAIQLGIGNAAGFVSAWSFPIREAPRYERGYYIGIGCLAASLVATGVYYVSLRAANIQRKKDGRVLLLL